MRVAVVTSADGGGAGIAARRFRDALAGGGVPADLVDPDALGERLPEDVAPAGSLSNRRRSDVHFSVERPGFSRGVVVRLLAGYDVVNVHWANGLVAVGEILALATRTRVVLTLHDFNHLTGGCHYPAGCAGFLGRCLACPQVDRARASAADVARLRRVRRAVLERVEVAAPSAWLAGHAVAAGARTAHVLRNPYAPLRPARTAAERGGDERAVLLVADSFAERRKNMALAVAALARWRADGGSGTVHLVGGADGAARAALAAAGVPHVAHGVLDHAGLTEVLRRADAVLTASTEDNWPNVLVEAGAYGAAAVTGPGHGCAEFVALAGHGRVATGYDAAAFAAALGAALAAPPAAALEAAATVRTAHAPAAAARRFRALFLPEAE